MRGSRNLHAGSRDPPCGQPRPSMRAAATLHAGSRDPPCGQPSSLITHHSLTHPSFLVPHLSFLVSHLLSLPHSSLLPLLPESHAPLYLLCSVVSFRVVNMRFTLDLTIRNRCRSFGAPLREFSSRPHSFTLFLVPSNRMPLYKQPLKRCFLELPQDTFDTSCPLFSRLS